MERVNRRFSVLIACLVAFSVVAALATTAMAHTKDYNRNITLQYDSNNEEFFGTIGSKNPDCKRNQTVTLYENGSPVESTTSDDSGQYTFNRTATPGARYYTRVESNMTGGYGHSHRCKAAQSRRIRPVPAGSTTAARSATSPSTDEGLVSSMLGVLGSLLSFIF
jgi:hypothetical protein